ncbi:hypothetical protein [Ruminiclostridium papyrosolvens]|uniref:Uncharacterized protein n=1 Tax=Ruminiclostridium papyrosolvens C7 TaxID=1330534 RepID=U4R3V7_9FIRM|nr:hypothetical protein [Ruminiclostridium papyrosolvens]EPR12348.1 hypothetical protein L323_08590 [Ruminiclostridium papyrosolvens C7]
MANKIDSTTTTKQMNNSLAWVLTGCGIALMFYTKHMDISLIFEDDALNKSISNILNFFSRLF